MAGQPLCQIDPAVDEVVVASAAAHLVDCARLEVASFCNWPSRSTASRSAKCWVAGKRRGMNELVEMNGDVLL